MRFKQPQNGTRMGPKLTPKNKRNRTREKHKRGKYLQRKNNLASLGNEASRKVSTPDMLRKVVKMKYQNNEDKEYLESMGDAKKEPFKKGKKEGYTQNP
jgi:hypothetical protein